MRFRRVVRDFYERNAVEVARGLLGKLLVRRFGDGLLIGRIVETEAYRGRDDPASHARRGITERNKPMFMGGGYAYIYFTYGNHWLLNVTAEPPGRPGAVLIRAVEPIEGVEAMRRNRGVMELRLLTSGPGRLTEAFRIDGRLNGLDLTTSQELFIAEGGGAGFEVVAAPRVGVSGGKRRRWRFYVKGNPYVSKRGKKIN